MSVPRKIQWEQSPPPAKPRQMSIVFEPNGLRNPHRMFDRPSPPEWRQEFETLQIPSIRTLQRRIGTSGSRRPHPSDCPRRLCV